MNNILSITYLAVAHAARQNEVIKTFINTFPDSVKDITRCPFPIEKIYCYICVDKYMETAKLVIKPKPIAHYSVDCELVIYQDIETIPLMNYALADSKEFKRD